MESRVSQIDRCPRCQRRNRSEARYCAGCGLSLAPGVDGTHRAGRTRHPEPLAAPEGFERVGGSADLYCMQSSAWGGGRVSPAENIALSVFNAGFALREVVLRLADAEGIDGGWSETCEVGELPRGARVSVEVASWRMGEGVGRLRVSLESAEYSPPEETVRWDR